MRKEFDLQCGSPDLTISGDEKLLFVCVVGQHVILGFGVFIKESKKVMQGFVFKVLISELQRGQDDVTCNSWEEMKLNG